MEEREEVSKRYAEKVAAIKALKAVDNPVKVDESIKLDPFYQDKVMAEITRLTEPPYTTTIENGVETKHYPPNYFNSDYLALKWFCESIAFNKEICNELLFNKNGNEFRVSVTNVGLATLAHWRCK
ncbi:MAG: hypothetical protein WC974_08975 [Thermoplasmata archaeon]